jgi:hypothetical protein
MFFVIGNSTFSVIDQNKQKMQKFIFKKGLPQTAECGLFVGILPSAYAFASTLLQATSPVLPTLTAVSTNVGGTSSGLDSTLLAALIGLGGVFAGILVSIVTTIYQARQNERIQRELARPMSSYNVTSYEHRRIWNVSMPLGTTGATRRCSCQC